MTYLLKQTTNNGTGGQGGQGTVTPTPVAVTTDVYFQSSGMTVAQFEALVAAKGSFYILANPGVYFSTDLGSTQVVNAILGGYIIIRHTVDATTSEYVFDQSAYSFVPGGAG